MALEEVELEMDDDFCDIDLQEMEEEIKGDYGPANIKYMQSNQMAPFGVDKYKLQGEIVPRFDIINGFENLPRIKITVLKYPIKKTAWQTRKRIAWASSRRSNKNR